MPTTFHLHSPKTPQGQAVIIGGLFNGRSVQVLPQHYLQPHYCLVRDCEFGVELTMRKEQLNIL